MAEQIGSVSATDMIYLFRIKGETGDAWKLALQTDGSKNESRTFESTPTKDGTEKTAGAYEATHSISSIMSNTVEGRKQVRDLEDLVRAQTPKPLEVWGIDRTNISDSTTIPGDYSIDYVTSIDTSAGAEGSVEVSIETEVQGRIISGDVTVNDDLLALLQLITEDQAFVQPMAALESGEPGGA